MKLVENILVNIRKLLDFHYELPLVQICEMAKNLKRENSLINDLNVMLVNSKFTLKNLFA